MLCTSCVTDTRSANVPKLPGKVLFWGDSITDQQMYPVYVETFFRTRFPAAGTVFIERGRGGDMARNLVRVKQDAVPEKADFVFIMLGMNDPGYSPDLRKSLPEYKKNITEIVRLLREANPNCRIVLMSPPTLEVYEKQEMHYYPYVLWSFSRELETLARTLNTGFIDQNRLYSGFACAAANIFSNEPVYKEDGPSELAPFMLTKDGIHPNRAGQSVLALNMLQWMGTSCGTVASLFIDGAKAEYSVENAAISGFTVAADGSISFRRRLKTLPFALPPDIVFMEHFLGLPEALNRDLLKVAGLKKGTWRLAVDGIPLWDFTEEDLAEGINLSEFSFAPDMKQARSVLEQVEKKNADERKVWRERIAGNTALYPRADVAVTPVSDPEYCRKQALISRQSEAVSKATAPEEHSFTLTCLPKEKARPWMERYQNTIIVRVAPLDVKQDGGVQNCKMNVTLDNITSRKVRAELFLEHENRSSFLQSLTLEPNEKTQVVVPAALDPLRPRYFLRVLYQPLDRSFPRLSVTERVILSNILNVPRIPLSVLQSTHWDGAARIDLDRFSLPKLMLRRWNGRTDLSVEARLAWNEEGLEMKAKVEDDVHLPAGEAGVNAWNCDSLQAAFWILKKNGKSFRWIQYNDTIFRNPAGTVFWMRNSEKNAPEIDAGLKGEVFREGTKTTYVLHIPWNAVGLNAPPRPGEELRFNFGINDRDSESGEWKYLPWTYGIWYSNAPAEYGRLRFVSQEKAK